MLEIVAHIDVSGLDQLFYKANHFIQFISFDYR